MSFLARMAALTVLLGLSACATIETPTRNAPLDTSTPTEVAVPFTVAELRVSVPETLRVSEANAYYPGADIVWREDPPGDRRAQVRAIFETAMQAGTGLLPDSGTPVLLDIEVHRFHALSEKARYTVGGVHSLQFTYTLRDPATGLALSEPRRVKTRFRAYGGQAAIEAERKGITQKLRITNHLARTMQAELQGPQGFISARLGAVGTQGSI